MIPQVSHYPNGFAGGVEIEGIPFAPALSGKVFYVDSVNGSDNVPSNGTKGKPWATLAYARSHCVANRGDIIYLKANHAETLATASAIALSVAGVTVIGLGNGDDRPTFTFSGTAATLAMSAAGCRLLNVIVKPSVNSVTSPIVVSAADCVVDVEVQDASDTVEFVQAILTTAAADRFVARVRHMGRTGGSTCARSVNLVGVNGGRVHVDFYGKASTAVVNFTGTACTDIIVTGTIYNSGTTDGSKNVIDTVTGSTWSADLIDATAGGKHQSGGSGEALAFDDTGTVAANQTVPTANSTANVLMRDVIGNKTDAGATAPGTTKSIMDYAKGTIIALAGTGGIATWAVGAPPGDGVSISEALRDTWDVLRNGTGGSEPGTDKSVIDALGMTGAARLAAAAGQLATANGTLLIVTSNVTSSSIPNNTQAGGAITGASAGALVLEEILVNTDATGWATPTNIEFSIDNANGKTGAAAPIALEATAAFGANASESKKDFTSHSLPVLLETGKKVYIHGDDNAGTGAGVGNVTLIFRRAADGATIVAANLP